MKIKLQNLVPAYRVCLIQSLVQCHNTGAQGKSGTKQFQDHLQYLLTYMVFPFVVALTGVALAFAHLFNEWSMLAAQTFCITGALALGKGRWCVREVWSVYRTLNLPTRPRTKQKPKGATLSAPRRKEVEGKPHVTPPKVVANNVLPFITRDNCLPNDEFNKLTRYAREQTQQTVITNHNVVVFIRQTSGSCFLSLLPAAMVHRVLKEVATGEGYGALESLDFFLSTEPKLSVPQAVSLAAMRDDLNLTTLSV